MSNFNYAMATATFCLRDIKKFVSSKAVTVDNLRWSLDRELELMNEENGNGYFYRASWKVDQTEESGYKFTFEVVPEKNSDRIDYCSFVLKKHGRKYSIENFQQGTLGF